VKQVPDPEAFVEIVDDGGGLQVEQKFTANLFDDIALEEALRIKQKHGGKVKVITLGTERAIEVLRNGIAMGSDEAMLIDDEALLHGDGYSTALALSRAVAREPFDIVLCGRQAIDDDRGEVGAMVAQFLDVPHVGGILKLDIGDGIARAECATEGGRDVIEVGLPAVFVVEKGLNEPRTAPITGVMKAMRAVIPRMTADGLGVEPGQRGEAGSKVTIGRYVPPKKRPEVRLIPGEPREAATEAVRVLVDVERVI
ncbi:MAG: electron transfer flavoprotein subunit beta/FixA family protein, partial [Syntrophorhabdales bacterium]